MKNKFLLALLSGGLVALSIIALTFWGNSPLEKWRLGLTDYLYLKQVESGAVAPRDDIVIVAIDDKTLTDPRFGRWQEWRRNYYAELLTKLSEEKPKAIGIDVTFSEESKIAGDDDAFAEAVQKAGNVVLVTRRDPKFGALFPIDKLIVAAGLGFVDLPLDPDNVVRNGYKILNFGSGRKALGLQSFALELARVAGVTIDVEKIPTRASGTFLINFFGRPESYRYISFADVLDGNFTGSLKDKILLIGVTPADLRDLEPVPTSFGEKMPGVEIHANTLQTLLDKKFLVEQSRGVRILLVLMLALLGAFCFNHCRVLISLGALAITSVTYFLLAEFYFARGTILDLVHPLLALIVIFIATYLYRYIFADRDKRQLKGAFVHYLAGPMVEKILEHPDALKLGGDKKELTIFFSDIAGFTTISEKLTPEALVTLLNDYLGAMTDIILESNGTLDKYIGDAVMAFWGAPLDEPAHATRACLAALDQFKALERLKAEGRIPHDLNLTFRAGLNTGDVVVGNMGSTKRFNYTVMGDAVNLASRLESVNKQYGTQILISEDTYKKAQAMIEARELDTIQVKGKTRGVRIYELVSRKDELSSEQKKAFPIFAEALATYRKQNWGNAEKLLTKVGKMLPGDGPTKTLLTRIDELRRDPPPADWDGVYVMKTK